MFKLFIICVVIQLIVFCQELKAQLRTNFVVKSVIICHDKSPAAFHGNVTNEADGTYLDANITLPFPVDDNYGITCRIEHSIDGKIFLPLFTIREKYACKAANIYMSEYWYEIERAAQIPAGVCPVMPGRYSVHHHKLNFNKIALQTFPFGRLKMTVNIIDNRTKKSQFCILTEVENVVN